MQKKYSTVIFRIKFKKVFYESFLFVWRNVILFEWTSSSFLFFNFQPSLWDFTFPGYLFQFIKVPVTFWVHVTKKFYWNRESLRPFSFSFSHHYKRWTMVARDRNRLKVEWTNKLGSEVWSLHIIGFERNGESLKFE